MDVAYTKDAIEKVASGIVGNKIISLHCVKDVVVGSLKSVSIRKHC